MTLKTETGTAFANKRVFLAGASGDIGRQLVPLLVAEGWHVVGTTRSADKVPLLRAMGGEAVVVDVFDALLSKRVYKDAWELDAVVALLQRESGTHFDPRLVTLLMDNLPQFVAIRALHDDTEQPEPG